VITLTARQVADAVNGQLNAAPEVLVTGPVVVDSRKVVAGALFVALPGEHADGADFAEGALADGATLVLAARELAGENGPLPTVVVADVQAALGDLARFVLAEVRAKNPNLRVIATTGSVGKTTTKDLIAQLIRTGDDGFGGETIAPIGSFNNEIGMPLTVLTVDENTQFCDFEMGADRPGNITYLAQIAPPNVGIVLRVGTAHMEGFGSREGIANAKAEMLAELVPDGVGVLNADDHRVAAMASRVTGPDQRVITFGRAEEADIRAEDITVDALGRAAFTMRIKAAVAEKIVNTSRVTPGSGISTMMAVIADQRYPVQLTIVGEHHVSNALAAATAAMLVGIPPLTVCARLGAITEMSPHRMAVTERPDGITVIDDAYNANPESMGAALKSLAIVAGRERRSVAVLGEMLELGEDQRAGHEKMGRLAVRLGIKKLIVVGPGAAPMFDAAQQEGSWGGEAVAAADLDAARAILNETLHNGDVVLVKASNGSGLWKLGDELAAGTLGLQVAS
jgi:UDP-N-acetylmuramoyl-tripeptide--D-alanyl-D-alanine ligase